MNFLFDIGNQAKLIGFAFFLAFFLFGIGITQFVRQRSARRELIGKIRGGGIAMDFPTDDQVDDTEKKGASPLIRLFGKIGRRASATKAKDYSASRLKFLRAGIRHENALAVQWGVKISLTVIFPAAFLLARTMVLTTLSYQVGMAVTVLCALLGFYLPDIWLNRKSEDRRQKLLQSLPDAMDLLVICVEAGMGLDSAINKVAHELGLGSPELSEEFHLMNLELRAGKQRTDALKNLALRTNLDEISSLTTLLVQTDKFGTSMADALRVYSESYRTQRYQKAEEVAAKLPVKMVIPLVFCIFPSLFLVILGPAVINIYRVLIKEALAP
jgi:tight adherence protein C